MTDLLARGRRAQGVRRADRGQRHRLHDPDRLDRQPDRPERRRQDDVLQHAHRRLQADRGPDRVRRPRRHRQAAARDHRARDRPHVPEHPPLPAHDRARERARRHALPAEGRHHPLDHAHARDPPRGGARPASAPASCSPSPACAAATTSWRGTSPTATSAGSRWRAPSRPSRSWCSWTSRPPG